MDRNIVLFFPGTNFLSIPYRQPSPSRPSTSRATPVDASMECRWNAVAVKRRACILTRNRSPSWSPVYIWTAPWYVGAAWWKRALLSKKTQNLSKFQVQPVHSSDVSRQGRQTFRHVALGFHCATQSMYPICLHPRQPIFWLCAYRGLFASLRRFPNTACSKTSRDTPWESEKR